MSSQTNLANEAPPARSPIAFLGLVDRAAQVREGDSNIFKWNLLGLKSFALFNFLPFPVSWHFVFAIRMEDIHPPVKLRITTEVGYELGYINMDFVPVPPQTSITKSDRLVISNLPQGWVLVVTPVSGPFLVLGPGKYLVTRQRETGTDEILGEFYCVLVEPAPLSPERIAAIRSDPHAVKAVRLSFSCKNCPSTVGVYTALDRIPALKDEGFIWYEDIPDQFTCECGSAVFDLRSIKRHFFAILNFPKPVDEAKFEYEPLYQESSLDNIRAEFRRLLDGKPREQAIQTFIEDYPILLHQFPAEKIFFKPPILTFYNADFAVLTPQKELILIEIETTHTRLLKTDGDHAAELTHAVNQVQNWFHVIDEHRQAFLASLKVKPDAVAVIRGVVIAGRDRDYNPEHLRRLKSVYSGEITVLTFDDLASGLAVLAREVRRL